MNNGFSMADMLCYGFRCWCGENFPNECFAFVLGGCDDAIDCSLIFVGTVFVVGISGVGVHGDCSFCVDLLDVHFGSPVW